MYNPDYYPTPKEVIRKMLSDFIVKEPGEDATMEEYKAYREQKSRNRIKNYTILDPSAGDGNILEFISEEFDIQERHMYAIEIEPDLQHMLRDKGFKVVGANFLDCQLDMYFDLIVMNPPFSNGDLHLLKAWDVLKQGRIICLLNAETINNPYSENRKLLLKIIEDNKGEIIPLGRCFTDAERVTDVEIVMIKLYKQKDSTFDFKFQNVTSEDHVNFSNIDFQNQVATRDKVGNMIIQMEEAKKWFIKFREAAAAIQFYTNPFKAGEYDDIYKHIIAMSGSNEQQYNEFNEFIRARAWYRIFDQLDIEQYMTASVRDDYDKFCKENGAMDFTKENVFALVDMIFANRYTILDQAIVEVFDMFTAYHKENRLHVEGWKTNDSWKVNRKIILPHVVSYGSYMTPSDLKMYGDRFSINHHYQRKYMDIDKAMSYITGKKHYRGLLESMQKAFDRIGKIKTGETFNNEGTSTFFSWKFWRKGTVHITFNDEWLWQEFNMRACAAKKWLPKNEEDAWKSQTQPPTEQPTTESTSNQLLIDYVPGSIPEPTSELF